MKDILRKQKKRFLSHNFCFSVFRKCFKKRACYSQGIHWRWNRQESRADAFQRDAEIPCGEQGRKAYSGRENWPPIAEYHWLCHHWPVNDRTHKSTVEKILKNEFYTGVFYWKGLKYTGSHPPIVDPDTFYQVQSVLRNPYKNKSRKDLFPYSNLIKCAKWGTHCRASEAHRCGVFG